MVGAVACLLVAAANAAGCGGGSSTARHQQSGPATPITPDRVSDGVQVLAEVPWRSPAMSDRLPAPSWAVSFDVHLAPGARLRVGLGNTPIVLAATDARLAVTVGNQPARTLRAPHGWLGGGSWHVEATNDAVAIDGRALPIARIDATTLTFTTRAGHPTVTALVVTPGTDHGLLLLHRLAELHARIPLGHFPVGATIHDRIVYGSTYWTNGFWPGALWEAAAVAPGDGLFARWALQTTIAHFGQEHADSHDVGFMYDESSLQAWNALCARRAHPPQPLCGRLERSVLAAADELRTLAATNPKAGTIPTNSTAPAADTIVDSMMNIAILPWASRITGDPAYAQLARHHADTVARLLVRADGSTAQAVNFDRPSGRVLSIVTHQGLSNTSTWSRGEGWAVYGFSQAAIALRDRHLLAVAQRAAGYVESHLPAAGVPLWDYDAAPSAPVDVSAGVITADGLFHLAAACRALSGSCPDPQRWVALGRRILQASLRYANSAPPLGLLGSQVLNEHGRGCWCDGGELIFGVTYGLEGLRLEGSPRR
jgi:hypothetical protein